MEYIYTLLTPSKLISLVGAIGLVLLFLGPRRRVWGVLFGVIAGLLYGVLGSAWIATWLLGALEYRSTSSETTTAPARAIVVLTGYARAEPDVPLTGHVNAASAFRLLEAARLLKQAPLPVYISGGGDVPDVMANVLRAVVQQELSIQIDRVADNTRASAVNLQPLLGEQPFYLVTSAGHMPRSIAAFRALGMQPIPAPTDFYTSKHNASLDWLPAAHYLAMSDLAVHERAGLLWYRLRGWIGPTD